MTVAELARNLSLGSLLRDLRGLGTYRVVDEWQQGEFHHDVVLIVESNGRLPGPFIVVATNCNGGVKEVLCLAGRPDRRALWHHRCPESPEFSGDLPEVVDHARTEHWFDPCDLLRSDARSEIKPEHRERQEGGGWRTACDVPKQG